WAASDLPARREFVAHHRIDYMNLLREAGATNEEAEWGAHVWAGWVTMTTFLREAGALTADEHTSLLAEVHTNIAAATDNANDPEDTATPGTRILEALRGALRSGDLYLTDVADNGQPSQMANRLGWMPITAGPDKDQAPGKLQHS